MSEILNSMNFIIILIWNSIRIEYFFNHNTEKLISKQEQQVIFILIYLFQKLKKIQIIITTM